MAVAVAVVGMGLELGTVRLVPQIVRHAAPHSLCFHSLLLALQLLMKPATRLSTHHGAPLTALCPLTRALPLLLPRRWTSSLWL